MDESPREALVADGVAVPLDPEAQAESENIGVKIVGGGIWRSLAYAFATVIAVISTAVVSRAIGPVDFAEFTTALSLIAIAMQTSDFGLLALGVREYAAQTGAARERKYRAMITMRFLFSTIAALCIIAFAAIAGYSKGLQVGLAFAAFAIPVFSLISSFGVPLQVGYRLNVIAFYDALRQGLLSGLMILIAVVGGGVGLIIAMNLPVAILIAFCLSLYAVKQISIRPTWDMPTMRGLIADVGTFAVAASIGTMYAYIAQVVCNAVLSPFDSGQFALAFRVYAVMLGMWMVAVSSAFPLLVTSSQEDVERMVYATRRLIQTALLAGTGCMVALVTGAEFVVAVLGGAKFDESIHLIALIGLALPATFALVTGSTVLLASGRHRELVKISISGALASIALTWFAASEWGGTGAALGIVVGEVVIATGYLTVVARIDRSALPSLSWILRVALAGAAACAVALTSLPGLAAAVVGGIIYLLVVAVLGVLPPELTKRIPILGSRAGAE